jgi:hypothetical protein
MRCAQEHAAVGAAVARIAVGKVLADIAVAQRAQQGIAQGMNDHITVRVRNDALRVGDAYTAQDHVISSAEGVHVHPLTDSHVTALPHPQYVGRHIQVLGAGDLDVERRARHQSRTNADALHRLSFVGHRHARARGILQCAAQLRVGKNLRGQRPPETGAIHGLNAGRAFALDGVDNGRGKNRAGRLGSCQWTFAAC